MPTRHGTSRTSLGSTCGSMSRMTRAVSVSPTTPSSFLFLKEQIKGIVIISSRRIIHDKRQVCCLPGHLCPPCSAGLAARQRPPGPLKLGCPSPLHAQALARGPLAAVRLHRTLGSGTARAAVRRRWRRCCQRGRTPAASRRLPGQRQWQAPPTATRPPSFGIQTESGVPLVVFHLSGPAVPASPEVRHPYPAPCHGAAHHGAAHQELGTLQGPASALRRHTLRGTASASPPSEAQGHSR
jgi:hypothetical protein